jgi:hypothetical protein
VRRWTWQGELTSLDAVVYTVLAAVFLLFVILLLNMIRVNMNQSFGDREVCKLSVQTYVSTQYRVANVDVAPEISSIDCSRRLITIGKDHIELNGKEMSYFDGLQNKTVKNYEQLTPDIVSAVVADELAGCWYQFLQGKVDLFGDSPDFSLFNTRRRCAICSEISFKQEELSDMKEPLQSLPSFYGQSSRITVRKAFSATQPNLHTYIFSSDVVCNTAYFGYDQTRSCIENYYTSYVNSKSSVLSSPLKDISSYSKEKNYVVLFIREGGSVSGKIFTLSPLSSDKGSKLSTYFAWVVDADELSSSYCEEYFA